MFLLNLFVCLLLVVGVCVVIDELNDLYVKCVDVVGSLLFGVVFVCVIVVLIGVLLYGWLLGVMFGWFVFVVVLLVVFVGVECW